MPVHLSAIPLEINISYNDFLKKRETNHPICQLLQYDLHIPKMGKSEHYSGMTVDLYNPICQIRGEHFHCSIFSRNFNYQHIKVGEKDITDLLSPSFIILDAYQPLHSDWNKLSQVSQGMMHKSSHDGPDGFQFFTNHTTKKKPEKLTCHQKKQTLKHTFIPKDLGPSNGRVWTCIAGVGSSK